MGYIDIQDNNACSRYSIYSNIVYRFKITYSIYSIQDNRGGAQGIGANCYIEKKWSAVGEHLRTVALHIHFLPTLPHCSPPFPTNGFLSYNSYCPYLV